MTEQDTELLAAEYALGTLDGDDALRAERLIQTNSSFLDRIEAWQLRLAPLGEAIEDIAPRPGLWERIDAGTQVLQVAPKRTENEWTNQVERIRQRLVFWRLATAAMGLAAMVLAGIIVYDGAYQPPVSANSQQFVALLSSKTMASRYLVTMQVDNQQLLITSDKARPPANKSYELWLLFDDGRPAKTLGLIEPVDFSTIRPDVSFTQADLSSGARIAVSLEPMGGAPDGRSMGTIVYEGDVLPQL